MCWSAIRWAGAFDLLYARTYPDEVAGLVLVDSPLPTERGLIGPELWEAGQRC